jgi:uncharacterized protein
VAPDQRGRAGITVDGHGVARAAPRLARARFGASIGRPRLADALVETNAAVARLRAALERFGVVRSDAVTGWLAVQEIPHEGVYRASHTIDVTIRDLARVGEILGGVLVAGGDGTGLQSVTFDVEDRTSLMTEARERAWEDARSRAEQLSAYAGRRLGPVTSVEEGGPAYRPMDRMMTFAAASAPEEMDIQADAVAVEVSLTVTWGFA